jgi:hypothetical protein
LVEVQYVDVVVDVVEDVVYQTRRIILPKEPQPHLTLADRSDCRADLSTLPAARTPVHVDVATASFVWWCTQRRLGEPLEDTPAPP